MKPGHLKFEAIVNGVTIKDGDYWLPYERNADPSICYPVKISSLGIHYIKKVKGNSVRVEIDGKKMNFYDDFEDEQLFDAGVELILLNGDEQ